MSRKIILALAFLTFSNTVPRAQQSPQETWKFAVSGDSRNCGDVVMPAIAKSVLSQDAEFYWHLGDFRVGSDVDDDMRSQYGATLTVADYPKDAWGDFLSNQIASFGRLPVYLGIGNHELYKNGRGKEDESYADFIKFFHAWLDSPTLRKQRLSDDPSATTPKAYFHWKRRPVDFAYLDNSKDSGFEQDQLDWLKRILARDKDDPKVLSVVVGMHRALPNSLACGHSMNGDPRTPADINQASLESGRKAYKLLLDFHKATGRPVYVLASHSHFFMDRLFETPFWKNTNVEGRGVLEGWLVGTAGARRYRLPDNIPSDVFAISYAYGYLLGTVHPNGEITFDFKQLTLDDVAPDVRARFGAKFVSFCFLANRDDTNHVPEKSCSEP